MTYATRTDRPRERWTMAPSYEMDLQALLDMVEDEVLDTAAEGKRGMLHRIGLAMPSPTAMHIGHFVRQDGGRHAGHETLIGGLSGGWQYAACATCRQVWFRMTGTTAIYILK